MKLVLILLVLLTPTPITLTPDHQFNWPGGHIECFDVDMIQVDTVERTITLHISDKGMCQVRGEVPLWNALIEEVDDETLD